MACYICLSSIFNLTACDNCDVKICQDCLNNQLDLQLKENENANCKNCSSLLIIHNKKIIDKYINVVWNYYIKIKFADKLSEKEASLKLIEDLISKREKVLDNYPNAVKFIIRHAFYKKISIMHKNNKQEITDIVNNSTEKCYNYVCTGVIHNDKCIMCDSKCCTKCKKIITSKFFHICDIDDLESLKFIDNDSVHCPNCNTYINKSEGCNEMTCTYCNYSFNYRDPKLKSHGNKHNEQIRIKDNKLMVILDEIDNKEIRLKLVEFIKKGDKFKKIPLFNSFFKCYKDNTPKKFIKTLQTREKNKKEKKLYVKKSIDIYNKFYNDGLNVEDF